MAQANTSKKKLAIDKANAQTVTVMAIASFLTVFSLVASHALLGQEGYQSRVIAAKSKALTQLKTNVGTVDQLKQSYDTFISTPHNVIGGSSVGTGDKDGDNGLIVLHALPSEYDFPALTSSLEKILSDRNFKIESIGGTDDELSQQGNQQSADPQPVAMPFSFSVSGANYNAVYNLIALLQQSIRPIQVDNFTITGGQNNMELSLSAHTYYQPEKDLQITKEVVR